MTETSSGDIDVELDSVTQLNCRSKFGDIEMRIADIDLTAELSTLSGDIETSDSFTFRKLSRGRVQAGDGSASVSAQTLSGDITLKEWR